MNPAKLFLLCGSAFAGMGVILGAFGAHALRKFLDPAMLSAWQTGVLYQVSNDSRTRINSTGDPGERHTG